MDQPDRCCFCVPLKTGVIISSWLWLIYGITQVVSSILCLTSTSSCLFGVLKYISSGNSFQTIAFYGLITIGAIFGLFVVNLARASILISIYSVIVFIIAGLDIISRTTTVIILVLSRTTIVDKCENPLYNIYSSPQADDCDGGYTNELVYIIAIAVVTILSSLYFAVMISTYASRIRNGNNHTAETIEAHEYHVNYDLDNINT